MKTTANIPFKTPFKRPSRERRLNAFMNGRSRVNKRERTSANYLENTKENREQTLNGSKNCTTLFTPPPSFKGEEGVNDERSGKSEMAI